MRKIFLYEAVYLWHGQAKQTKNDHFVKPPSDTTYFVIRAPSLENQDRSFGHSSNSEKKL